MANTFNPNSTYSSTGGAPSASSTTTTLPGTSQSTTTQGATTQSPALSTQQINQFIAAGNISATDRPAYVNGNQLTSLGQALSWYLSLDRQPDRQQAQEALVALSYLPGTDATGEASGTALTALKAALTSGKLSDFQQALSNPTTPALAQATTTAEAAEKTLATAQTTPVTVDLTDTNSLNQSLSKAFEDALGYQPSATQMNTFAQSFHAAQTSEAEAPRQAEKEAAQQEITNAQSEESALNKLGPDGLDSFIGAYTSAIHGINPAAGSTSSPQGPITGSAPNANYMKPGTKLPPDTTAGFNSSGTEMFANTLPTTSTSTQQVPAGLGQQLKDVASDFNPFNRSSGLFTNSNPLESPDVNKTVTTSTPTPGMATAPNLPAGLPGTAPSYGGFYSLSTAMWQQIAKAGNVSTTKYPTAGSAPLSIQQGAFSKWAQDEHDAGQSWSDVAITALGGTPSNASKTTVSGKAGTNLQNFAKGITNQMNSQLEAIQNQANNLQAPVVTKEAPNPAADELAAAESSDPNQYIAHNMSLGEGTLQKMLYGTPQIEAESTSNLAGDVAQVSASNSVAT